MDDLGCEGDQLQLAPLAVVYLRLASFFKKIKCFSLYCLTLVPATLFIFLFLLLLFFHSFPIWLFQCCFFFLLAEWLLCCQTNAFLHSKPFSAEQIPAEQKEDKYHWCLPAF